MTPNQQLITTFYQSFQEKKYRAMQNCYADDAVFNDPVFVNLNATEVRAMWEMFCTKGNNLHIQFSSIEGGEKKGSAEWIATHTS